MVAGDWGGPARGGLVARGADDPERGAPWCRVARSLGWWVVAGGGW